MKVYSLLSRAKRILLDLYTITPWSQHSSTHKPSHLSGEYIHCARRGLDKNSVSTTAPERAVLSVMSLGVALRTDESGASEAAETFIFLASI